MSTLVRDSLAFETHQRRMLFEILVTVRDGLIKAGVTKERKLRALTEDLAFHLACIIDGSTVMHTDAIRSHPVLTFTMDTGNRPNYSVLVFPGGGSWMHEMLDKEIMNEAFARDDS